MKQPLFSFNRGRVSPLALARTDQKRVALAAETQTNWIPRIMGPMSLRPGLQYLFNTRSNEAARYLRFVFSTDDQALLELTSGYLRVAVSDAIITRGTYTTAVTNGTFATDITGWTDSSDAGASIAWYSSAGFQRGSLDLVGTGTAYAHADQEVTVTDVGAIALRVVVGHGYSFGLYSGADSTYGTPVEFSVGSTQGASDIVSLQTLDNGVYSFSFDPGATFWIRFSNGRTSHAYVAQCSVESSGDMLIPHGITDLDSVRYTQSGDVVYVASYGYQPVTIKRYGTSSWGICRYAPEDGPLLVENTGTTTIAASATTGTVTLTASKAGFWDIYGIPGRLVQLTSAGQDVSRAISAENTFSNSIRIFGAGTTRAFTITITGTWVGTVTLQRSFDDATWSDVATKTWTANTSESYNDTLDNQIIYYRMGIKTGGYTSGTATVRMTISIGSITGVARIRKWNSGTVVDADVLSDLGSTAATDTWALGEWRTSYYPTAVALADGRLWWAGRDHYWGSISDAYDGFDPTFEGDAGPISRSIGSGPVDKVQWLLPLQRLLLGGQGAEYSIRSSSLDEPITPSNVNIRPASGQGSSDVSPAQLDDRGVFVQRGGSRVYELAFSGQSYDYTAVDMTTLIPEIGDPGIVRMDAQRQPDTRIHGVRSDGTVALAVFDRAEEVLGWVDVETDGTVEDVIVMPGTGAEDRVYYVVNRTINGSAVRHLEKWALESECRGGTLNKQADAFETFTNAPASATVSGLTHLVGESVIVWADGKCLRDEDGEIATFTVSAAGTITLTNAGASYSATTGVVGLPYTAQWKSAKLASQAPELADLITREKRIPNLGLILAYAHHKGLKYGPSFDRLDPMPDIEQGTSVAVDTVHDEYAESPVSFPGQWLVDARLCLQAQAPRPCTVLAAIPEVKIG